MRTLRDYRCQAQICVYRLYPFLIYLSIIHNLRLDSTLTMSKVLDTKSSINEPYEDDTKRGELQNEVCVRL